MTSESEDYAKQFVRGLYQDIPALRPLLIDIQTRRLIIRKLARAFAPEALPRELVDAVLAANAPAEVPAPEPTPPAQSPEGRSYTVSVNNQRGKLLGAYVVGDAQMSGLTDEEAAVVAGLPARSCWWKRAGELREGGYIEVMRDAHDFPVHRKGQAGVDRQVCIITDYGLQALASMEA